MERAPDRGSKADQLWYSLEERNQTRKGYGDIALRRVDTGRILLTVVVNQSTLPLSKKGCPLRKGPESSIVARGEAMKGAAYRTIFEKARPTAGPVSCSKRRIVSGKASEDCEIARDGCEGTKKHPTGFIRRFSLREQ